MQDPQLIELIQKELDTYIKDNSTAKQLFTSMKEISVWLATKEKQ